MVGAVGSYHPGTVSPNFQADSAATARVRSLAVVLRDGVLHDSVERPATS